MFLDNHLQTLVSVDFFVVPTVMFKVLFVFVVLAHERRRVLHINVTDAPTAQWTAQQLVEAFPWETAPTIRAARSRCRLRGRVLEPSPNHGDP
jgi:putative transposase